jgi:hypothetical protein
LLLVSRWPKTRLQTFKERENKVSQLNRLVPSTSAEADGAE